MGQKKKLSDHPSIHPFHPSVNIKNRGRKKRPVSARQVETQKMKMGGDMAGRLVPRGGRSDGFSTVRARVSTVRARVGTARARLGAARAGLGAVRARLGAVRARLGAVRARLGRVSGFAAKKI